MGIVIGAVVATQLIGVAYLYGWYTGRVALRSDLDIPEEVENTKGDGIRLYRDKELTQPIGRQLTIDQWGLQTFTFWLGSPSVFDRSPDGVRHLVSIDRYSSAGWRLAEGEVALADAEMNKPLSLGKPILGGVENARAICLQFYPTEMVSLDKVEIVIRPEEVL
jgi:hypothetical protein